MLEAIYNVCYVNEYVNATLLSIFLLSLLLCTQNKYFFENGILYFMLSPPSPLKIVIFESQIYMSLKHNLR